MPIQAIDGVVMVGTENTLIKSKWFGDIEVRYEYSSLTGGLRGPGRVLREALKL